MKLRVGTRGSALAHWQASWVATELARQGADVELVPISTRGDRRQEPFGTLAGTGLFTKEIQRALLERRADVAVHSLKDLPTETVPEIILAAVPPRATVGDALLCGRQLTLDELPGGAVVGTGSLRRRAQLLHLRPDLQPRDVRGNVDTRIAKLRDGQYDALVLAQAGLIRLGLDAHITQLLDITQFLPAVGQGALGLECRIDDLQARQALERLNHPDSFQAVIAERAMLAGLRGGCLAPIAAWGRVESGKLVLTGRVLSSDGTQKREVSLEGPYAAAAQLGEQVADYLLAQGAGALIAAARG